LRQTALTALILKYMPNLRKLIVVLGAHRSGTSLCAAAVECLGADLCTGSKYANEENHKGFFEHPDIVAFNDRLLSQLGGSWDSPLFNGRAALARSDMDSWLEEAVQLLKEIFAGVEIAAIKDPRICQLLDFWIPVFEAAGYESGSIFYVHTIRDIVEVAVSQKYRSLNNPAFYEIGKELEEGAALWASLTAQALLATRSLPILYVPFERLVREPAATLTELSVFLDIEPSQNRIASFCAEFVDGDLYRSVRDPKAQQQLSVSFPQALEFGAAVQALAGLGAGSNEALASVLEIYDRADTQGALKNAVEPALARLSESCRTDRLALALASDEVHNLERQRSELNMRVQSMRQEHEAVAVPLATEIEQLRVGLKSLQADNSVLWARGVEVEEDKLSLQAQITELANELEKRSVEHRAALEAFRDEAETLQAENIRVEAECAYLLEQRSELEDTLENMRNSVSWKITRPIRAARSSQIAIRQGAKRLWARFRVQAIQYYHRISLSHPGTAWNLRRALRPAVRGMDRILADGSPAQPQPTNSEALAYMKYQRAIVQPEFSPLISVIIPNFNHAPYLSLRLDSVFSQTYQNFEVILLDDASSDSSSQILESYHERHKERSTLVINTENSGSVFRQWQRGLELAKGDIVWIAESDDWCSDNFLEALVPFFENEAVQLAYSRTAFMDKAGDQQVWSINEYLHDIDPQRWNQAFVETGSKIVSESFAIKNIVPNVSSALFRTPKNLELLQDPEWLKMQTCGDWILYLHLLRGGMLAYSPAACNYYRMHGGNTSVASHSKDEFYKEHEQVAKTVQQYFDVSWEMFERLQENLGVHWRNTRSDFSQKAFEACFSLDRIRDADAQRAPNLLMASYAFCAGGGETFPVSLANIMKGRGYNVTYLDCGQEPRNDGVRKRLRPDIPIVSNFRHLEKIVHDFDIDVIHSHHAWMDNTILDLLPENTPVQTVVTLHGMYETINEYDLKPIMPRLARRSACLIYVAEKNLAALRRHKLEESVRLARIDNALQVEDFEPVLRQDLGISEDAFVLTLVSRGMVEKGWIEAIEAVALARESCQRDIQLLLVGDGPEYERMLHEVLPEFVHLKGFQRNVRGYFAMADLGFLPSKFRGESFPLVIIECLQAGTPFLSSDLGEISHMLDSEQGMAGAVVGMSGDEIDVSGMAREIALLAADSSLHQSLAACVTAAAKKFDPTILARKHDEVYRAAAADAL
jgi:glycosyltransferase involved in cell wall biosynthesis